MAAINWRTINVDALDPESSANFDLSTLTPAVQPISTADVQTLSGQVKQLLRGGDQQGALVGALENVPYGADSQGKVAHAHPSSWFDGPATEEKATDPSTQEIHLATVTEILQSIRQSEMSPMLQHIYQSEGGSELCDTLMKYLYKGMSQSSAAAPSKSMTPQATGFSQMGSRSGAGEGQGHAMSVLLSWHEKVSRQRPRPKRHANSP